MATESLQDGSAYSSSPPFNPAYKDNNTGEYVPDVGGLAFGYPRAQSMWHAGIFGSLSPTLVGGGAYHYMTHSSPGTKCKKGGVVYLDERWLPTGQGVLSFSTAEQAAEAIDEVTGNYEVHCKAAREIGWRASTGLEDGLSLYLDWLTGEAEAAADVDPVG